MSYDLSFWRYKPGIQLTHQDVYERLSDGNEVAGLEDLPIDQIRQRIAETFADWEQLDHDTWEGESAAFQIYTTKQFFRMDCYAISHDDMNKVIEVLAEFQCPLHDAQVNQRFDGS